MDKLLERIQLDPKWQSLVTFTLILIITFVAGRLIKAILDKFFNRSAELINVDLSRYNIVKHLMISAIYVIGIGLAVYSMPTLRSLSLSIFAGAGIMAAIIGFASQKAFSNIISGIFIAIFKPFRVDDRIQVGTHIGVVEDITLRHTVIRNFENKRIVIPNAVISDDTVTNFTIIDEKICKIMEFRIGLSDDIALAKSIIQETAVSHPKCIDTRTAQQLEEGVPPVVVRVIGWGEYSINLRAWIWTRNPPDAFEIGCDLYEQIKYRFDEAGIQIPAPHRVIMTREDIDKRRSRVVR